MSTDSGNTVTAKQLREELHSVFVLGLTPGSSARDIAQQSAGPAASYLRGKDGFDRACQALLALPGSNEGGQVLLKTTQGNPTSAGSVIAAWQKVAVDRAGLFDETGPAGPTILVVQAAGIDQTALWQEDQNKNPRVVTGDAGASLSFFETALSQQSDKKPEATNGIFQALQGAQVSVKRRGNTSRWDQKINITVALDDDKVSGFPKQLNLLNCIRDPAYMRIRLAWSLMAEARCPSEPCAYAELTLDGQYRGTYVAMPPPDDYFFQTLFPDTTRRAVFRGQYGDIAGGATLAFRGPKGTDYFTAGSLPSLRTYEPRLDTADADYDALAQFIQVLCNHPKAPATDEYAADARKIFDVEGFLRVMAVINLLGAWDNYYLNAQNYLLHISLETGTGQPTPYVSFCAYDLDSVLGVSWPGQKRNWQEKDLLFGGTELGNVVLIKRLLQNPLFHSYYCDFMAWFLENRFTLDRIGKRRGELWQRLQQTVYLESPTPWGPPPTSRPWTNDEVYRHAVLDQQFDAGPGSPVAGLEVLGISNFIQTRRNVLAAQLKDQKLGQSKVDFDSEQWQLPR